MQTITARRGMGEYIKIGHTLVCKHWVLRMAVHFNQERGNRGVWGLAIWGRGGRCCWFACFHWCFSWLAGPAGEQGRPGVCKTDNEACEMTQGLGRERRARAPFHVA